MRDTLRSIGRLLSDDWYGYSSVYVYVNDKLAYCKTNLKNSASYNSFELYLITLKNGAPCLFMATRGDGDVADVCGVFSYRGGMLSQTLNDSNFIPRKYVRGGRAAFLSKVSGNRIILKHQASLKTTGAMVCEVPYVYKSGKFVRQGTMFKPKVGVPQRYGRSYKALRNLSAYKKASCKSKKFVIKKGQRVKFVKLYAKGSKMALQVKVGKRTGWIKCASSPKSSLLVRTKDGSYFPPFKGLYPAG